MLYRSIEESDYAPLISVINDWWGGRHMADMLPKLFFIHFRDTGFAVEDDDGRVIAFLIGFVSQTYPQEAYVHFVGVDPQYRKQGIAERLYEMFGEAVKAKGCNLIRCVTSPVNKGSIAFHQRIGFQVSEGDAIVDGVAVSSNYDGQGSSRVLFVKKL